MDVTLTIQKTRNGYMVQYTYADGRTSTAVGRQIEVALMELLENSNLAADVMAQLAQSGVATVVLNTHPEERQDTGTGNTSTGSSGNNNTGTGNNDADNSGSGDTDSGGTGNDTTDPYATIFSATDVSMRGTYPYKIDLNGARTFQQDDSYYLLYPTRGTGTNYERVQYVAEETSTQDDFIISGMPNMAASNVIAAFANTLPNQHAIMLADLHESYEGEQIPQSVLESAYARYYQDSDGYWHVQFGHNNYYGKQRISGETNRYVIFYYRVPVSKFVLPTDVVLGELNVMYTATDINGTHGDGRLLVNGREVPFVGFATSEAGYPINAIPTFHTIPEEPSDISEVPQNIPTGPLPSANPTPSTTAETPTAPEWTQADVDSGKTFAIVLDGAMVTPSIIHPNTTPRLKLWYLVSETAEKTITVTPADSENHIYYLPETDGEGETIDWNADMSVVEGYIPLVINKDDSSDSSGHAKIYQDAEDDNKWKIQFSSPDFYTIDNPGQGEPSTIDVTYKHQKVTSYDLPADSIKSSNGTLIYTDTNLREGDTDGYLVIDGRERKCVSADANHSYTVDAKPAIFRIGTPAEA